MSLNRVCHSAGVGVVVDYADMVLTVGIVSNYMDTVSAYSQGLCG